MSRLLDGAVIEKCGECDNKDFTNRFVCSQNNREIVNMNTIDKDCPLAEVEYYPNNADLQNLLNMDTLSAEFLNNIEAVIIVKKRGDK